MNIFDSKISYLTGTLICSIESLSRIVTDCGSTNESKSTVIQYGTAISSVLEYRRPTDPLESSILLDTPFRHKFLAEMSYIM